MSAPREVVDAVVAEFHLRGLFDKIRMSAVEQLASSVRRAVLADAWYSSLNNNVGRRR